MSRNNTHRSAGNAVVAHIRPLVRNAGAAARRQSGRARAWTAPQLEHAGKALQDDIAPRAAGLLSAAARRVEPARPRRPRWRKLVGASAITATASALAAAARRRAKGAATAPGQEDATDAAPAPMTAAERPETSNEV